METKLRDEDQAARDTHTHTHTHKRSAKGERERIRTQRKKNKRERERERKRAIVGKEQRARTFGNLDHFFRFLWRVSCVERKIGENWRNFGRKFALENFGCICCFFFSACVVFLRTHQSAACFDVWWWRKKRTDASDDDARKAEEASALFSLKETRLYVCKAVPGTKIFNAKSES